eukprot:TRINITY_DN8260_c0_g2_i1.p1 TRINITY_DN8260_c0_g2~~TRINITY_DN8260_c0_g2_i1.p1  ORF type:complete len:474 (+),score=121.55 TRINITY_DN8260_c0_g2_i1:398-1819(+)
MKDDFDVETKNRMFVTFNHSCIIPVVQAYLRNDSLMEMVKYYQLYLAILSFCNALASKRFLVPLLETHPTESTSIQQLVKSLNRVAKGAVKTATKFSTDMTFEELQLAEKLSALSTVIEQAIIQSKKEEVKKINESELNSTNVEVKSNESVTADNQSVSSNDKAAVEKEDKAQEKENGDTTKKDKPPTETGSSAVAVQKKQNKEKEKEAIKQQYLEALKELQFDEKDIIGDSRHSYRYKSMADEVSSPELLKTKMKRLIQEMTTLSTSLPLFWESSIFVRVDSERPDVMQALIIGPVGTPYANGCFVFDIYCPNSYPSVPPKVNLETTGNGSVRFNPNLYNCGKVCLSLLGTWNGDQSESWNSVTSTLIQVLISIQSLIFVEKPYFNEPGYESSIGSSTGENASNKYNENIRYETARVAIKDQLLSPAPGFEDVIRKHFFYKKKEVISQLKKWKLSNTIENVNIKTELEKLEL